MTTLRAIALSLLVMACSGVSIDASGSLIPADHVSSSCASALANLTDALFALDSRLDLGLTYADYGDKVADAKVAYDRVRFGELDTACVVSAGKPAEDALNEYLSAYSTWKDCIEASGCQTDSIKTELQNHWSTASGLLAAIRKRLP